MSREPPREVTAVNYAGHWNRLRKGSRRGSTGTSGFANAHFWAYITYSSGKFEQTRGRKPLVCKYVCCGVEDFIGSGRRSRLKTTPSTIPEMTAAHVLWSDPHTALIIIPSTAQQIHQEQELMTARAKFNSLTPAAEREPRSPSIRAAAAAQTL